MYVLESYNCINRNCKTVSSSSMLILTVYTDLLLKHHIFIWLVTASIRYNLLPTKHVLNKLKWLNIIHLVPLSDPWQWETQSWGKFCLIEPEPHHYHTKNLTLTLSCLLHVQPISPTPRRQIMLEKLTAIQLSSNYLPFIGPKSSLSHSQETWARWIQSTSSYVVIFSHLCLGQASCSFLWGCLTNFFVIRFSPFTWRCFMSTQFLLYHLWYFRKWENWGAGGRPYRSTYTSVIMECFCFSGWCYHI